MTSLLQRLREEVESIPDGVEDGREVWLAYGTKLTVGDICLLLELAEAAVKQLDAGINDHDDAVEAVETVAARITEGNRAG